MLSFRLRLSDLSSPAWRWADDRWINGDSWIKPVTNPVLEWKLAHDNSGRACGFVRERCGTSSAVSRDAVVHLMHAGAEVNRMHPWPSEYVTVEMQPGWARITAGPFGTAPLYLVRHKDVLIGSWHLPDLRPYVGVDNLLDRAVVRRLIRQPRYSADTLFTDVHQLTERAVATFTTAQLTVDYPEPAEHVLQPRELRAEVDPVGAFHNLLTAVVAQTPGPVDTVGVELSGGADSANVAVALAALRDDTVRSYGLIVGGRAGIEQQVRRQSIVTTLGLHDVRLSADDHPPFAPGGVRALGVPHDPASAYYREAFDVLCSAVAANGARVIFTGLGGDEISAMFPQEHTVPQSEAERVPWLGPTALAALPEVEDNLAPVSAVPLPTLMAFALHNHCYLHAGIWPISPLAHPTIGRFFEQLPADWRHGKHLLRQRLRRAGFSEHVVDPRQPENFRELMQTGLRHHGLPRLKDMLQESILIDGGYLDHHALSVAYEQARSAPVIPSTLCDVIAVETGLRSLQ